MLGVPPGFRAAVTGASSGIGEEIARQLAARGVPLLLVARSGDRLEKIASELQAAHGVAVETHPLDLAVPGAARALFAATEGDGRPVDLLVLAAGFGFVGPIEEQAEGDLRELLALNVAAVAESMRLHLGAMKARGRGRILTVASTAGTVPDPWFAAYGASKAFVLSLSRAAHVEAKPAGVVVTCVCPGYTPTRFHARAGRENRAGLFPRLPARAVAARALDALERGKDLLVPNPLDALWVQAMRFLPRAVPVALAARVLKPRSR